MFEQLSSIYQFLVDRSRHIALRVSIPLLSLLAVLIINDLSGFSRTYFLNDKLSKMAEIQKMEPNVMQTDPLFKQTYESTKKDLLVDHSYLRDWYSAITTSTQNIKRPTEANPTVISKFSIRDRLLLNISSMLISYLISLMLFGIGIAAFFNSRGVKQVWNTIRAVVLNDINNSWYWTCV